MSCVNKRQCGYICFIFGVFFVFLGIICGFLLPKKIKTAIEDKACIDSKDDPDYENWEKPSSKLKYELYYWDIQNKDGILYRGETPQLKERGPYVYAVANEKVGVAFNGSRFSYYIWKKMAEFVQEESCAGCSEDDKLTVFNLAYLGLMEPMGGDTVFSLYNLPSTIKTLLSQLNYTQLGDVLSPSLWPDEGGSGFTNPEFGAWLRASDPTLANTTGNFTELEMRGLYDLLGNIEELFGAQLSDPSAKLRCQSNGTGQDCGFIKHLMVAANSTLAPAVMGHIASALCQNLTHSCFNVLARLAVIPAIGGYIQHLGKYTLWRMLHEQDDIIATLTQKQLARGYNMKMVTDPLTGVLVSIPGIMKLQKSAAKAQEIDKITMYLCNAGKEKLYQWAAFNGKEVIPDSLFPNLTQDEKSISGYQNKVPKSEAIGKPCSATRKLPMESFDVFINPIYTKFTFTYKEEISLHDMKLERFVITKDTLSKHSTFQQGLFDQSKLHGAPVVLSLPHFLYSGNISIPEEFAQKSDEETHQSTYDVDPVTGAFIRVYVRAQVNIPVKLSHISHPRITPLNVSYVTGTSDDILQWKIVPVLWSQVGGEATESDINTIKKKVIALLNLSCGLLIALPIIGCIFIIGFIVLLVISFKANQVTQIPK